MSWEVVGVGSAAATSALSIGVVAGLATVVCKVDVVAGRVVVVWSVVVGWGLLSDAWRVLGRCCAAEVEEMTKVVDDEALNLPIALMLEAEIVEEGEEVRGVWIDMVLVTDKLNGKLDDVVDEERDGEPDDELGADTLLTKPLREAEDGVDTGTLLAEPLVVGVLRDMVEEERVDEMADDAIEETPIVALETGVVVERGVEMVDDAIEETPVVALEAGVLVERGVEMADDAIEETPIVALAADVGDMESAKAGAIIVSPQARAAMELLRRSCMMTDGRMRCRKGGGVNRQDVYLIKEREKGRGFGSVLVRSDDLCVGEGHFIP